MAMTREEQRRLDEIEAVLAAENPALDAALRGSSRHRPRGRAVWPAVAFGTGLTMVVAGMAFGLAVVMAGFLVMMGGRTHPGPPPLALPHPPPLTAPPEAVPHQF